MADRRFSHDQARDILRRAERARSEGDLDDVNELSERELLETAKELGIDEARLVRAIAEADTETDLALAVREVKSDRRAALRTHLFIYVILNASLGFIDFQTGGGFNWAHWPFFFFSLWLVAHVVSFLTPDTDKIVEKARRRVRSKRWKERGKKLGRAIEKNVGELIDRATKE